MATGKAAPSAISVTSGVLPGHGYDLWESWWVIRKGSMKVCGEKPHKINIKLQTKVILFVEGTLAAEGFNKEKTLKCKGLKSQWDKWSCKMATLQLCPKQQRGQHLPSQENSLQVYCKHEEFTSARPSSLRQAQATALSHIPWPACSSQIIISIFSMTTRYLSATHFICSLTLLARLAHSLLTSASITTLLTFWFYSTLYIQYSS